MRYLLLLMLLFVGNAWAQVKETGPDVLHFNGHIKQAKVYTVDAATDQLITYSIYETNGDRAYTIRTFSNDNRLMLLGTYITNNDRTKQDITEYLPVNNQNNHYIKYLQDGKPMKVMLLDAQNNEQDYEVYEYDKAGHLRQIDKMYDTEKGDRNIYAYEGDTVLSITAINTAHEIVYYVFKHELDEHGNPIKVTTHTPIDKQTTTHTYKYTYDEHGNFTQAEMYNGGVLQQKVLRMISY